MAAASRTDGSSKGALGLRVDAPVPPTAEYMARLKALFEPGMAIYLEGVYKSRRVAARRSIHLRVDRMTGEYSLGPQSGRAQKHNIGGDGAKPRIALARTVVDGVNTWHTCRWCRRQTACL